MVYLVYAPLWYGNADYIRLRVCHLVDAASAPVHAVIFDADGMSDIDYTGLGALRDLDVELRQQGVTMAIARASRLVHRDLKHGEFLQHLGSDQLFGSVEEAVERVCSATERRAGTRPPTHEPQQSSGRSAGSGSMTASASMSGTGWRRNVVPTRGSNNDTTLANSAMPAANTSGTRDASETAATKSWLRMAAA